MYIIKKKTLQLSAFTGYNTMVLATIKMFLFIYFFLIANKSNISVH